MMKFEKYLSKKWKRIKYSRTTKLFSIILTIQTLLVGAFQIKLALRDARFSNEAYTKFIYDLTCVKKHFINAVFFRMERESCIIFYIQAFLCVMGLDAIVRQYTPQIKIFTLLNFLVAFFGIFQVIETKVYTDKFNKNCGQIRPLDPGYFSNEIPNIAIISSCACLLGYLSYKLIDEFKGLVYKKIGSDRRMQKMFKTRLLLIMLLRINAFFVLLTFVPTLALIITSAKYFNTIDKINTTLSIFHIIFALFSFRVLLVASASIRKENGQKLRQFMRMWSLFLINTTVMFVIFLIQNIVGPSFVVLFGIPFTLLGVISIKCATNVILTFNKGMKEYVGQVMYNRKLESVVPVIRVYDEYDQTELEKPTPAFVVERTNIDEEMNRDEDDYELKGVERYTYV